MAFGQSQKQSGLSITIEKVAKSGVKVYGRFFIIVFIALAALRFFLLHLIDLFADEALYHFLALHAPLNFCPHPPGVPLLSRIGTALMGRTELGARLMNFILASLTLIPVYRLAYEMGGITAAKWSIVALATTPLLVMVGIICTPDGPQLFFYALALLLTWRAIVLKAAHWWVAAGFTVGVALYIKYIIILYFPAVAIFLLLTPAGRDQLKTKGPYLCALSAFLVFVPFFFYREWISDWAAFRYHLGNRQRFIFPSVKNIAIYQLVHVGYYSPVLYGLYLYAMAKLSTRAIRTGDVKAGFLASFAAFPWLFFAAISAVTERGLSREQWDAMAYIPALIGAALLYAEEVDDKHLHFKGWLRVYKIGPAIGAFLIILIAIEGSTGALSASVKKKLLFANLIGWKEMAVQTDDYLKALPEDAEKLVIGDSFAPALEYAFYSESPVRAVSIFSRRNEKYGLEQVLAACGAGQDELGNHLGCNAVFIYEEKSQKPHTSERRHREEELHRMFSTVTELPILNIKQSGRDVRAFRFYQCLDLKQPHH